MMSPGPLPFMVRGAQWGLWLRGWHLCQARPARQIAAYLIPSSFFRAQHCVHMPNERKYPTILCIVPSQLGSISNRVFFDSGGIGRSVLGYYWGVRLGQVGAPSPPPECPQSTPRVPREYPESPQSTPTQPR